MKAFKTIGVRDLQAHIGRALADAQRSPVVVLKHARPVAVIVGVEKDGDVAKVLARAFTALGVGK